MDLDFYAVVTSLYKIDGTWIIEARCETCRADVRHGGTGQELPDVSARVPHCRCPFPAYVLIEPSAEHPVPEPATKAELRSNEPLTKPEIDAVLDFDCPGCHAVVGSPCTSPTSRWRTCPARLARLLKG